MGVRSNILTDIEVTLSAVTGVGTVTTGKVDYVDLDNLTLPAVFIIQGAEEKIPGSTEHEAFRWAVAVETWCKDVDVEPLHAAIHQAMAADPTRGGYAINSYRQGSTTFAVDPGRGLAGFTQEFNIEYRHPLGSP